MARKRMIDPSFWEDEKLGTLEPVVRLLFMGLISQADDEGRLKGHPSLLRSIIFPYDESITIEQIESWLSLMSNGERRLIVRYEVDNQKYIWVRNFKKHQTINKPQNSKLPHHSDDYGNCTVEVQEQDSTVTAQKKVREEKLKEEERKGREDARAPDDDHIKDRLLALINQMNIQGFTLFHLDTVYSYIGVADVEVIEACIKKSQNKPHSYLTNTLDGIINKDGIKKKEHLPGANGNVHHLPAQRGNGKYKQQIPVAKQTTGRTLSPEERERIQQTVRELDVKFNNKGRETS